MADGSKTMNEPRPAAPCDLGAAGDPRSKPEEFHAKTIHPFAAYGFRHIAK